VVLVLASPYQGHEIEPQQCNNSLLSPKANIAGRQSTVVIMVERTRKEEPGVRVSRNYNVMSTDIDMNEADMLAGRAKSVSARISSEVPIPAGFSDAAEITIWL
jgi:hypothetical protein